MTSVPPFIGDRPKCLTRASSNYQIAKRSETNDPTFSAVWLTGPPVGARFSRHEYSSQYISTSQNSVQCYGMYRLENWALELTFWSRSRHWGHITGSYSMTSVNVLCMWRRLRIVAYVDSWKLLRDGNSPHEDFGLCIIDMLYHVDKQFFRNKDLSFWQSILTLTWRKPRNYKSSNQSID